MTNPETNSTRRNIKTATLRRLRRKTTDVGFCFLSSTTDRHALSVQAVLSQHRKAMYISRWARTPDANAPPVYSVAECLGGTQ